MKLLFLAFFLLVAFTSQAQLCPDSLQVISKIKEPVKGDTLVLQVKYKNGLGTIPTYHWSLSDASILEGQGTATIKIATDEMSGDNITATVELGGYADKCNTTASKTVYVMKQKFLNQRKK